jgi:tetratricopeptide (TPR) repeat protein
LGESTLTLNICQRALELQREIGARYDQPDTLDSIARAHYKLGHDEQAVCCCQEAIQLYKEFGDRYNEADEFMMLGEMHLAAGRVELARAAWKQAISIFNRLGHPEADKIRTKLAALAKHESRMH